MGITEMGLGGQRPSEWQVGAPGTRVWPASLLGGALHLDIPRAPPKASSPTASPSSILHLACPHVPPLGHFHKQMPRKASKVGQRRGS